MNQIKVILFLFIIGCESLPTSNRNQELYKANVECQEKLAKQDYVRGVIDTMALICPALVDKVGLQVKEMAKKK